MLSKKGLFPCPFCGRYPMVKEEEYLGYGGKDYSLYHIWHRCEETRMRIATEERDTEQEAMNDWNGRV